MLDDAGKIIFWVIGALLALSILMVIGGAIGQSRLYDSCRADGLKDYECYGLVYGRGVK